MFRDELSFLGRKLLLRVKDLFFWILVLLALFGFALQAKASIIPDFTGVTFDVVSNNVIGNFIYSTKPDTGKCLNTVENNL
jgi:hypothetical protein